MNNKTHLSDSTFYSVPVETQKMFNAMSEAVVDALMVPASWLPESYRGKKSSRKLRSVVSEAKRRRRNLFKEDREVSVKFDAKRNITDARPGRLAVLEKYRADVEAGREIEFDVNEDKLYRFEQAWCGAMLAAGVIEPDAFDEE
jgi:hypothetical protein